MAFSTAEYKTCVARAPAKAIFIGEHSVAYGQSAIAAAIDLQCRCAVTPRSDGNLEFRLEDDKAPARSSMLDIEELRPLRLKMTDLTRSGRFEEIARLAGEDFFLPVKAAVAEISLGSLPGGFNVALRSDIPRQRGFGSSAAAGAAAGAAFCKILYGETNPERVRLASLAADNAAHAGMASGVDGAPIAYGGVVRFRKGQIPQSLPTQPFSFIVALSGSRPPTARINLALKQKLNLDPEAHGTLFSIEELACETADLLTAAPLNMGRIGSLANEAQARLERLGLGGPETGAAIRVAKAAGACGAKLSGAGMGGMLVAFAETADGLASVRQALEDSGFTAWIFASNTPGASCETA